MARTTINSQGVPVGTITASDLSYPLADFSSTGIDDNASSNAITISSGQAVTMSGLSYPTSDGSANQVLTTDGSGALTFADTSSGGVEYVAKTTTYTASANEGIIANTSGGAWTLTLPASPSTGDKVFVADGGDWSTNNLTVARNGSTIEGSAADFIMNYGGVNVGFIYDGSTWQVYPQAGLLQLMGIDDNATSTALTISSAGNVGIGGAASYSLTVDDSLGLYGSTGVGTVSAMPSNDLHFLARAGQEIAFFTDGVNQRMTIDTSGYTNITVPLTTSVRLMRQGATSDAQTSGIVFGNDFSTNGLGILASAQTGFRFKSTTDTSSTGPLGSAISTDLMRIDSSGHVGIGCAPVAVNGGKVLEVESATGSEIIIGNSTVGTSPGDHIGGFLFKNSDTSADQDHYAGLVANAHDQYGSMDLEFYAGRETYETSGTPHLFISGDITNTGYVGIGTTSPAHELHIAGTEPNIRLDQSSGTASTLYGFEIVSGSAIDGYFRSRGGTGETQIGSGRSSGWGGHLTFYTDTTERMRINSSGNLSIGSTGSAYIRLLVTGSHSDSNNYAIEVRDSSSNVMFNVRNDGLMLLGLRYNSPYNFTTSNSTNAHLNSSGGLQRSTSSRRYKSDITDMPYGLSDVMNLRPVTFEGINDPDGQRFGGFIAEEVHDAGLTEFVDYNNQGQPDALAYGNMVALLAKAVQEAVTRIETLEAEVAALKAGDV